MLTTGASEPSKASNTDGLAPVVPLTASAYAAIVERFCERYPVPTTQATYRRILTGLFTASHRPHPANLTESDLIAYCTGAHGPRRLANNTVYTRIAACRQFMAWCVSAGLLPGGNPAEAISGPRSPLRRSYKRTYGKVQSRHPGRWLSREEATRLCDFPITTDVDLRDVIVLRLGLLGMRRNEIRTLTVANVANLPAITWTGKGRKPRQAHAGPTLHALLSDYLDRYAGRLQLAPTTPLVCPAASGSNRLPAVRWGTPAGRDCVYRIVQQRASAAGLGHLATHDLRRTTAGILHHATTDNGAHQFDLLDIQRVLGHSDPATTMRCYLDPIDTAIAERASRYLD